ncbi:Sugar (pentulose or hexulose) kinase [Desulfotomaculum arcticum]|uniref:Sugar (Pentulose or hexulose) kinase n=1 Tax=Desulfotruncus arcticus DSM 17038 TaxID=1121424 RepID=A0A1I2WWC3_9FIRM|nr:FGGY-family carbohydrate kinase [Desulfotruncus arcticus]SFH04696.1 Sugar (pentulose or hexulose) kinase [Desulfotomaculum arcticum] [Desulfotruncus arcticus DSM 17038]
MYQETVLAIDVGTQSVRALAFNPSGQLIDQVRVIYTEPYRSPRPGWAEQDPGYYWQRLAEACRKLWSRGLVDPAALAAVSLTSQRATLVNLDRNGDPLRPAIVWLDQRRAGKVPSVGFLWSLAFRLAGLGGTLNYLRAEAEANWLREHQPSIWARTAHYLFLSGYLTYRLTGSFVDSIGCQVGYIPFDYRRQTWPPASHWKWRAIPVPRELFPELVPPGRQLGEITAEAAAVTGLPEGLPVIAAASDKACEVLGSGCLEPHQGCIGYGTTATINVNSARYIEPIMLIPPYPSACPGEYNLEVQIYRGFWMVSWFKEEFAWQEQALSRQSGVPVEELLDRLAAKVRPGSMGLVLQPFWSPGLKYPGPEAKGAVIGFGGVHTRAHLYRALLEGLAYAVREGRERIERRSKIPVTEIKVCGGGSRSDQMMQITADVFGLPAVRPAVFEASGLGAAMLAAVGAGLHPDLKTAVGAMTGPGQEFQPNREAVKIYDRLYRKVFRRMYRKLLPAYKDICNITNYPETPSGTR